MSPTAGILSEMSIANQTVTDTIDICVKHTFKTILKILEARHSIGDSIEILHTKQHKNMGDFLHLSISNSQNEVVCFEKKFPKDITIADLKVINSERTP